MSRAAILLDPLDIDTLDTFGQPESVPVAATALREGMVLLDPDLGTPAAWLDHRQRAAARSGSVQWLAHDLETGRLTTVTLHRSTTVRALATV